VGAAVGGACVRSASPGPGGAAAGPACPAPCRRWWGELEGGGGAGSLPDPAVPPRLARPPAPVQVPSAFRRGGLKTPRGSPVRPRGRGGGPAWSRGAA
jgi:hypothetical protein